LADFTDAGLKPYGMLFWCSPTGTVFSNNKAVKDKATAMAALQKYVEDGGAWGGVHSATDFEKTNGFPWFTNTLVGAYFQTHDNDGTPGTVQLQTMFASHPVMKGLSTTYSTQDEWYQMNRDVSAQPGFQILARLAKDNRPLVWVKDISKGRMFYTVRGHNKTVYAEKEFRTVVQNGIMWATHRVN
jgi:type 1 glutamine amidotransferase